MAASRAGRMEPRLGPIAEIFALNADLATNCVEGLGQDEWHRRLSGRGNSMAFLLAHLVDARHFLLDVIDSPIENPLGELLADAKSIDEVDEMPPVDTIVEAWRSVSAHLMETLEALGQGDLDRVVAQGFPIAGGTALHALAFLAQHDSYHVGQMAFLRRQLDHPAMTYTRSGENRQGAS